MSSFISRTEHVRVLIFWSFEYVNRIKSPGCRRFVNTTSGKLGSHWICPNTFRCHCIAYLSVSSDFSSAKWLLQRESFGQSFRCQFEWIIRHKFSAAVKAKAKLHCPTSYILVHLYFLQPCRCHPYLLSINNS